METITTYQTTNPTPGQLLQQAIERGVDIEALSKLMDLQERYNAQQARKSFFESFTRFQSQCPEVRKTKSVQFNQTSYAFAPLSDITRQINKTLKDNGLSFRWEIQEDADAIKVSCMISHVDGHTETTTMSAKADTSGAKNAIQARGSTVTYLQRYTLIGALGISTADQDIDARLPEYDIDKLHKEYMGIYNQVIQLDSSLTKYHPDNWKTGPNGPTGPTYVKAIQSISRTLLELKNPKI